MCISQDVQAMQNVGYPRLEKPSPSDGPLQLQKPGETTPSNTIEKICTQDQSSNKTIFAGERDPCEPFRESHGNRRHSGMIHSM